MNTAENPFAPGAGSPPPQLAGRDEVMANADVVLRRIIAGTPDRGYLLLGLRGVGKTVLLNRIEMLAESAGYHTVREKDVGKSKFTEPKKFADSPPGCQRAPASSRFFTAKARRRQGGERYGHFLHYCRRHGTIESQLGQPYAADPYSDSYGLFEGFSWRLRVFAVSQFCVVRDYVGSAPSPVTA